MIFKELEIGLFGELLQALYECEVNFRIDWFWDGGFEWTFGDEKNGYLGMSQFTKRLTQELRVNGKIDTNLEYQGGLIITEFIQQFTPFGQDGEFTAMTKFLWENDFMNEIHYDNGFVKCDASMNGVWVFDVYETHDSREATKEGSYKTYSEALERIKSFT